MKASINSWIGGAVEKAKSAIGAAKDAFSAGQKDAGAIPKAAAGGVFEQATLAIIGEAGTEAAVPKRDAANWLPLIASWAGLSLNAPASAVALAGGGGGYGGLSIGGGITVIVQAPPGTDNPRAWGGTAGDALYDRLSRMIKL